MSSPLASVDTTVQLVPMHTIPNPTTQPQPSITGTSASSKKKKKKKKSGGGGGASANDAVLAERMRRLMEPLPEDLPPQQEEWSKVPKGAGIAKQVAKNIGKCVVSKTAVKSTALDPDFAVLRKFDANDDASNDHENAVDLDSYTVSTPFYHTFEDTGASAWCAIVTSASGFDSQPVPITVAVPRMRKIKGNVAPPTLEKEEKREVVEEFRKRQREVRKAEKANKPKKNKIKKGKGEKEQDDEDTAVATISVDGLVQPKTLEEDTAALSDNILNTLFAPAQEQQYAQQPTQGFTQQQVREYQQQQAYQQQQHQQMLAQQQQQRQQEGRQFLQDWSAPGIGSQQQVLEAQNAQMAEMQRQLVAALQGQEEAKRIANQAQMAAAHAAAAAAAAQAAASRDAGMRKENWRGAPIPGSFNGGAPGGRKPRGNGNGPHGGRGGPRPGFAASTPPGFGASAPEAPAAPPTFGSNSYVPPAFRGQTKE